MNKFCFFISAFFIKPAAATNLVQKNKPAAATNLVQKINLHFVCVCVCLFIDIIWLHFFNFFRLELQVD
jgi:hypothetical protein